MTVYDYSLLNKAGEEQSLKDFEGKCLLLLILLVNVVLLINMMG